MAERFRFSEQRWRAVFYLVIVPVAVLIILILGVLNWQHQRVHEAQQAKTVAAVARARAVENSKQIKTLRAALSETCHVGTTHEALLIALIAYIRSTPRPEDPSRAQLLRSLIEQSRSVSQLSACAQIERP